MDDLRIKDIRKNIYTMIFPIILENVLQMTTGLISMAIIGRISAIAVAAIGLSSRITQVVWAIFKGITTGATVFVAQAYGAGNNEKLKSVIKQTLMSSIVLAIALQQLIYWNASSLLKIFSPKTMLMENSLLYLKIVSFGLPSMVIMLVVAGVLQGMGNSIIPAVIALIMNIVNIVLSYILVFGKFGAPAYSLKGAAFSLVIAQSIGAFTGLMILFRRKGILKNTVNEKLLRLDIREISRIYRVGIPSALESVFWQLSAIVLTKIILSYGEIAFAAYQIGLQAEAISYMPAVGFYVAATAFIGQSLGAGNKDLGKLYIKEIFKGAVIITTFCAAILFFLPREIMGMLTTNYEIIIIGAQYLLLMGPVQFPQNLAGVLNGAIRGAGYTEIPMIISAIGLWGVRIPLALFFTYKLKTSITGIWIAIIVDLSIRFVLSAVLYKKKNIYSAKALV